MNEDQIVKPTHKRRVNVLRPWGSPRKSWEDGVDEVHKKREVRNLKNKKQ